MKKTMQSLVKLSLATAIISLSSSSAQAGGVNVNPLGTGTLNNTITTITQFDANNNKNGYTSNPALDSAGWGHAGRWYSFHTHMNTKYRITASSDYDISPAFSIWKTDGVFDGGENENTGEKSTATKGTPHSFNQVGNAGDYGLWWATDDSVSVNWNGNPAGYDRDLDANTADKTVGNSSNGLLELIGYASDGPAQAANGWGLSVASDGVDDNMATLDFTSMMHGDYVIFVSGANGNDSGIIPGLLDNDGNPVKASINLEVSQVPVPAAVYLFGSGLLGLFASRRKLAS